MKVLLLQDVYKLGRAGDVKKVADGYGRNYLLPQGMGVLATVGALKQAERIRASAELRRAQLNHELGGVAEHIRNLRVEFPMRAATETNKLYGSVSTQMIADAIKAKSGIEVNRRLIDIQPIRLLGEYKVPIRLTMDLVPEVSVVVYREGEARSTAAVESRPVVVPVEKQDVEAEGNDESVHQSTTESSPASA
ncbi:MAG: 50S ribosomal protein L9 [Chloroflexota bacterium]